MRIKRLAIIILFCFLIASQGFAALQPKIEIDEFENLYHFWVDPALSNSSEVESNELKFSISTLSSPADRLGAQKVLYSLTQEAVEYDLKTKQNRLYLVYAVEDLLEEQNPVYLTYSMDSGQTFSFPLLLTEQGSRPALAFQDNLVTVAWEEKEGISYTRSQDRGTTFVSSDLLLITGETLSSPALFTNLYQNTHLFFFSQNLDTQVNCVKYAALSFPLPGETRASLEPKVLFKSYDDLINLGIQKFTLPLQNHEETSGILVYWQNEYMERRQTYYCVSLDGGLTFSQAKPIEFEKELLGLTLSNGKLALITYAEKSLGVEEIELPHLAGPEIISPLEQSVLNASDLMLSYAFASSDPFLCQIELGDENLVSQTLTQFVAFPSSEAISYALPLELEEGSYSLIIKVFDGLNHSPPSSPVQFLIDNTPPRILTLEAQRKEKELTLAGKIDESLAWLTINDQPVTLEASNEATQTELFFESHFTLAPGQNLFTLALTDGAGNLTVFTQEAFYDPAVPELTVLTPGPDDWFKPDSVILFEVQVKDLQDDIEDGSQASIEINHQILEESLTYDQEEGTLFGFVSLPSQLSDGIYPACITLWDKSGNQGSAEFKIQIDGSPPVTEIQCPGCFYTNSPNSITLPLADEGAGLDPTSTLIKISGISMEASISLEAERLILNSNLPLIAGTYEVELTARDQIGNLGEPIALCLVVDTTPPEITLLGSYEASTLENKMNLKAKVKDEYPSHVDIYNNQIKIESFALGSEHLSKDINLFQGNNEIEVQVFDHAGNQASVKVYTHARYAFSASSLIQSCQHGPNPFSPSQDLTGAFSSNGKGMVFSYTLSQPADIKILIFDLTGTLIWTKEIQSTASGVTAWSGTDAFGKIVKNGVYPYVFSASSGGTTQIKRGKIIVYQ